MAKGNRSRIAMIAVAFLAALSVAGFAAGPANAAQSGNSVVAAKASVEKVQRIPLHIAVTPNYAVTCYAYISTPNESGTASTGYRMSVVGSTTCSPAVTYLRMIVYLYWNGNAFGSGSATGTSYVTATANGPCLPGSWFGELDLEIIWPAGVTGPPTYTTRSNTISFDVC